MNKTIEAYHALIQSSLLQGEGEVAAMYSRCIAEEVKGITSGPYKNTLGEFHFHFNWKGGGFNSAWGHTKERALEEVKAKFGAKWEVDQNTFRVNTVREERIHDRSNTWD